MVFIIREVYYFGNAFALENETEYTVIRTNEIEILCFNQKWLTLTSHPRIDYRQMDGILRKISVEIVKGEGCAQNVEWLDVRGDVYNFYHRVDPFDHPFDCSHISIFGAEIGNQRNDWFYHSKYPNTLKGFKDSRVPGFE